MQGGLPGSQEAQATKGQQPGTPGATFGRQGGPPNLQGQGPPGHQEYHGGWGHQGQLRANYERQEPYYAFQEGLGPNHDYQGQHYNQQGGKFNDYNYQGGHRGSQGGHRGSQGGRGGAAGYQGGPTSQHGGQGSLRPTRLW